MHPNGCLTSINSINPLYVIRNRANLLDFKQYKYYNSKSNVKAGAGTPAQQPFAERILKCVRQSPKRNDNVKSIGNKIIP